MAKTAKAMVKLHLPALPPLEGPAWREWVLLALVLLSLAVASYSPVWDPDSFWHLAVGREMWQGGHLVRTETFSFTAPGVPWEDTEWLFHAMAYPIWHLGGDPATGLFTAAAAALALLLLYRSARLAGADAASFTLYSLLVFGAYVGRTRFRPDILSMILFAILVEALLRWDPRAGSDGRFRWLMAGLFCLWAQCHGGWTFGMALLGARIAGEALDSIREGGGSPRYLAGLALTGVIPAAAVFLNPYGWQVPWFPIKSLIGFSDPTLVQISEWQHSEFTGSSALFLATCAGILALLLFRWRRLDWRTLLPAASQAFLGWYWVRYQAFAAMALLPPLMVAAAPWIRLERVRRAAWGAALMASIAMLAYQANGIRTTIDLSEKYPVQEVKFLKREGISGNLYHIYGFGGYLDWTAYPECRIFADGRYYPFVACIRDYWKALSSLDAFQSFLEKYPIDVALYAYPNFLMKDPGNVDKNQARGPSAVLFPAKEWALVDFGNACMVLVRREPKYARVIAESEYRILRPDDLRYLVAQARRGALDRSQLADELRRKLEDDPWTRLRPTLQRALDEVEKP